jgi:uncharacterized radical SAM superfamily Fe-S cluster-containing enzyme
VRKFPTDSFAGRIAAGERKRLRITIPEVLELIEQQTDGQIKKLDRKRYSCSVISFFWGVDKPYETLPPHTLFLAHSLY